MYLELFSPHHLALLHDWLSESGELYVDLYYPHSGGSGPKYFVRSLHDLKELISQQTHPEIEISIFRRLQYPLRGLADDSLLERALRMIPENHWYQIVSLDDYYPLPRNFLGCGDSHSELRQEFDKVRGRNVGIGTDPFDYHDTSWVYTHANEVMYLSVKKNRNNYEEYSRNPQKYESIVKMWRE